MRLFFLLPIFFVLSGCMSSDYIISGSDLPVIPSEEPTGANFHVNFNNNYLDQTNFFTTNFSGLENYSTGVFEEGLSFNGSSYVTTVENINISGWNAYTMCFWFNWGGTGNIERPFRFDYGSGQMNEFFWFDNKLWFRGRDIDSTCTSNNAYTFNYYRFICASNNGTTQHFYIDNFDVTSGGSACDYDFSASTGGKIDIGINTYSGVDEVWLFNRTLTSEERILLRSNNTVSTEIKYCLKATNSTNIFWESC